MNNKRNILYFASSTMAALYKKMDDWQEENQKRLLSMSIQKDADEYCCIALTNPSEVVIVDCDRSYNKAKVSGGKLQVG